MRNRIPHKPCLDGSAWLFHRELCDQIRNYLLISALVLVALAACGSRAPASPTAPPTPAPGIATGFAIHLLAQNTPPEQLATLSHLELGQPILSITDVVTYARATHEIELTSSGYEKIHGLSVPVSGKAFAVCVDGQPIYAGAFWVGYSSLSFDGIVIDTILATEEHPVIQIQLGYPGPAFFRGDDPRSDPRVLQALERAGKLR
jgi:hypothetical protein